MMKGLVYPLILIAVAFMISACGSDTAERSLYNLEKLYSQALRAEKELLEIKPELTAASDLKDVVELYQKVVDNFRDYYPEHSRSTEPGEDELKAAHVAGLSLMQMGNLNIQAVDTSGAKAVFSEFENLLPYNHDQQRLVWTTLADIHRYERNWDTVEQINLKLIEKYDPPANAQLNPYMDVVKLPFDMMRFYGSRGDQEKSQHYVQFAEDYYIRMSDKYPQSNLGLVSTRFLAETYKYMGRAEEAVKLLQTVTDSTGQTSRAAMMLIAEAYFENLNRPEEAKRYYQMVLDRGLDSNYTPQAAMHIGQVLLLQRQFSEARRWFNEVLEYDFASQYFPQARRYIGISYDEEKDYDKAKDAYMDLIEAHPTHSLAFDTYLYMPDFFEKQNKKQLRDDWYNRAEEFFMDTREKYENRNLGAAGQEYLCRFYMAYEKWDRAIHELRRLAELFPEYNFASEAYFRIAAIFEKHLNQPDSAKFYYSKQAEVYPNLPISETAKNMINNL